MLKAKKLTRHRLPAHFVKAMNCFYAVKLKAVSFFYFYCYYFSFLIIFWFLMVGYVAVIKKDFYVKTKDCLKVLYVLSLFLSVLSENKLYHVRLMNYKTVVVKFGLRDFFYNTDSCCWKMKLN